MFNKEQREFIKIQMDLCIRRCKEDIKKYGHNDEATAGADDSIEMANIIKALLDSKTEESSTVAPIMPIMTEAILPTGRPIEVEVFKYAAWSRRGIHEGVHKGTFHGFFSEGDLTDGVGCVAAVELDNGEVLTIGAEYIKFLDK